MKKFDTTMAAIAVILAECHVWVPTAQLFKTPLVLGSKVRIPVRSYLTIKPVREPGGQVMTGFIYKIDNFSTPVVGYGG